MAKENETASEIKSGADVHVVLANGKRHPARITRLNKDGTADLAFFHAPSHGKKEVVITGSPRDEEHKTHDSWDSAPLAE